MLQERLNKAIGMVKEAQNANSKFSQALLERSRAAEAREQKEKDRSEQLESHLNEIIQMIKDNKAGKRSLKDLSKKASKIEKSLAKMKKVESSVSFGKTEDSEGSDELLSIQEDERERKKLHFHQTSLLPATMQPQTGIPR